MAKNDDLGRQCYYYLATGRVGTNHGKNVFSSVEGCHYYHNILPFAVIVAKTRARQVARYSQQTANNAVYWTHPTIRRIGHRFATARNPTQQPLRTCVDLSTNTDKSIPKR
jgi:hypothetical protein